MHGTSLDSSVSGSVFAAGEVRTRRSKGRSSISRPLRRMYSWARIDDRYDVSQVTYCEVRRYPESSRVGLRSAQQETLACERGYEGTWRVR